MEIRKLDVNDIPKVINLIKKSTKFEYLEVTIYSSEKISKYFEILIGSNSEISGYYYFGVYHNNNCVGFIEWRILEDCLFLNNIFIDDKYQGKGIANKLMFTGCQILQFYKKIKYVRLDVDKNNSVYGWYKKIGFKVEKTSYLYPYDLSEKNLPEKVMEIKNFAIMKSTYDTFGFTIAQFKDRDIRIPNNRYFVFEDDNYENLITELNTLTAIFGEKEVLQFTDQVKSFIKEKVCTFRMVISSQKFLEVIKSKI